MSWLWHDNSFFAFCSYQLSFRYCWCRITMVKVSQSRRKTISIWAKTRTKKNKNAKSFIRNLVGFTSVALLVSPSLFWTSCFRAGLYFNITSIIQYWIFFFGFNTLSFVYSNFLMHCEETKSHLDYKIPVFFWRFVNKSWAWRNLKFTYCYCYCLTFQIPNQFF